LYLRIRVFTHSHIETHPRRYLYFLVQLKQINCNINLLFLSTSCYKSFPCFLLTFAFVSYFFIQLCFFIFRISSCSKIIFISCPQCPDSNSQNHKTDIYFLCRFLYRYPLPYPMQIILFQILIISRLTLLSWLNLFGTCSLCRSVYVA